MQVEPQLQCLICGFGDGRPFGTGDICECCGGEVRIDDWCVEVAREYRIKWLENGAKWSEPSIKPPDGWDLFAQLKQIPDEYR